MKTTWDADQSSLAEATERVLRQLLLLDLVRLSDLFDVRPVQLTAP